MFRRVFSEHRAATVFELAVSLPVVAILLGTTAAHPSEIVQSYVGFWVIAVASTELLPLPTRGRVQLSLNFPILLAVLILYRPLTAGTIAFVGAFDRREFRREVTPLRAVFNRSQIALSVMIGSVGFHAVASVASPWYVLAPAVLLATVLDYVVNMVVMVTFLRLSVVTQLSQALFMLRVGALDDFLLNYMGLYLIGIVIFELYHATHTLWTVVAFIAPLVFARQMFFRTMALEEATEVLKDREQVLRALSNRMAEERQDERLRIADYLHDDLAQSLFQLTLRLEMAKKRLTQGELSAVMRDLDRIGEIKQRTSEMVRSLVRDLHHAPIGRTGLPDALERLADEMTHGTPVRTSVDVVDVPLPPPIQLLIYQIAREAVMNSMKHAEPRSISISLVKADDGVDLTVGDDGAGFDTSAPQPEGHFGSVMMRERAVVTGGSFKIESQPGRGTTVTAHFPEVWVQEGTDQTWNDETSGGESASARDRDLDATEPAGPPALSPEAGAPLPEADHDREDPPQQSPREASA